MRTTWSDLDSVQRIGVEQGTRSQSGCLCWACKGVQALAPPGSQKKIWEEVLSLSICLSIYLTTNNCGPCSRIKWEIYFYKEVFHSFVHWSRKSSLITFPLVFVLQLYNTSTQNHYYWYYDFIIIIIIFIIIIILLLTSFSHQH